MEIKRLHLASLQGADGRRWPVHGFVVTSDGDAVLVDTGVGAPQQALDDWRVVNRSVADALAELDLSPADIGLVINTHLHFDHCGQNAVFGHAPFYVQRAELDRMQREAGELYDWFGFMNARFELLDGDEIRTNLRLGLGFSTADRDANIRRIAFVARLLSRNGVVAITAAISPYRAIRDEARRDIRNFIEVFVDCPLAVCATRDVKGLYAKALRGEIPHFTGVSGPYDSPANPELWIHSDRQTPDESADLVLARLVELGYFLADLEPV